MRITQVFVAGILLTSTGLAQGNADLSSFRAVSGAQTRSVADKLRDILSVRDFGAVGDGVHDDLPAFQALIAQAPASAIVYVPDGRYLLAQRN
jgi:polygalacturonase